MQKNLINKKIPGELSFFKTIIFNAVFLFKFSYNQTDYYGYIFEEYGSYLKQEMSKQFNETNNMDLYSYEENKILINKIIDIETYLITNKFPKFKCSVSFGEISKYINKFESINILNPKLYHGKENNVLLTEKNTQNQTNVISLTEKNTQNQTNEFSLTKDNTQNQTNEFPPTKDKTQNQTNEFSLTKDKTQNQKVSVNKKKVIGVFVLFVIVGVIGTVVGINSKKK